MKWLCPLSVRKVTKFFNMLKFRVHKRQEILYYLNVYSHLKQDSDHGVSMVIEVCNNDQFHVAVRAQKFPFGVSYLHAGRDRCGEKSTQTLIFFWPWMNKFQRKYLHDQVIQPCGLCATYYRILEALFLNLGLEPPFWLTFCWSPRKEPEECFTLDTLYSFHTSTK